MNKHQEEHEVYGGEIADVADMEGEEEMPVAPHFSKEENLDDMKKRLRHIEDEASALPELHARVEKEMGVD